jgi:membrane protein DedA with SNARE-associated domain
MIPFLLCMIILAGIVGFWLGYKLGKWRGFKLVWEEDKQKARSFYETRKKKYL